MCYGMHCGYESSNGECTLPYGAPCQAEEGGSWEGMELELYEDEERGTRITKEDAALLKSIFHQLGAHIQDVAAGIWPDEEYTLDSAVFTCMELLRGIQDIVHRHEVPTKSDGIVYSSFGEDLEALTRALPLE